MSKTFKFIEVLDYGSGYDSNRYLNNNGNLLVVSNGAVILESIADIVGNSNITIPSIEVGLLNSVPHYTGNTLPYILEDTAVYISNIGDMTGVNELHTTDLYVSGDTVSIINNDLTGIKLFNNDTGSLTQFNMPTDTPNTYEYIFKVLDEPRITLYTASNIDSGEIWLHGGDAGAGSYVGLKASNLVISDNTIYTLPKTIATTNEQVLTVSNTTAELSWTSLNYPTSFIIPWTSFEWFVLTGGGGDFYYAMSTSQNGPPGTGTPNRTFGAGVSFIIPVSGTYRFTVNFRAGANEGIATFLIDGVTTTVDTYRPGPEGVSYTWTQYCNSGERNVVLSSLTKNGASGNYYIVPLYNGITVIKE